MIIFVEEAMFLCNIYTFVSVTLSALTETVTVYTDL